MTARRRIIAAWRIAGAVRRRQGEHRLGLLAAGVAFYGLLSLIPALIASVSVYGLFASPNDVADTVDQVASALPREAEELLSQQLRAIARQPAGALSVGVILGVIVALWTASSGIKHLLDAIDVAYGRPRARSGVIQRLKGVVLAVAVVVAGLVVVTIVTALPAVMARTSWRHRTRLLLNIATWPITAILTYTAIKLAYIASDRRRRRVAIRPGAATATIIWLVGSIGFSLYTANFSKYNETYGSLGAVVILLLWMVLSVRAVLIGAEINAIVEDRRKDANGPSDGPPNAPPTIPSPET